MKQNHLPFILMLQLCIMILCSCNSESDNERTDNGLAPGEIVGKTLILKNKDGSIKLSAEHLNESGILINNITINYNKYPPSYSYSTTGVNKSAYHLEATKETYIPYYHSYTYGKFIFEIDLTFTSVSGGIYTGIQTNAYGNDTNISGNFTLK